MRPGTLLLGIVLGAAVSLAAVAGAARPGLPPTRGTLLVAAEQMRDPRFARTVLLVVEHSAEGSMGLVLNRTTDAKLATVFPGVAGLDERGDALHAGGPVAPGQVLLVVRSAKPPDDRAERVVEDVYLTSDRGVLDRLLAAPDGRDRLRLFVGYAGWAGGQLDRELERGDWHVLPGEAGAVFAREPTRLWDELVKRAAGVWA